MPQRKISRTKQVRQGNEAKLQVRIKKARKMFWIDAEKKVIEIIIFEVYGPATHWLGQS